MLKPAVLIKKHIGSIRVRSQYYFNNKNEPNDNISHDTQPKDEAILSENSLSMKLRFRQIAKNIRIITIRKRNRKNHDQTGLGPK